MNKVTLTTLLVTNKFQELHVTQSSWATTTASTSVMAPDASTSSRHDPEKPKASKPKKRFVGTKSSKPSRAGHAIPAGPIAHQIPQEILDDPELNTAINMLPPNYSFEIHKTIHHVRKNAAKMVALQMPEGLQMFACTIADIIERFTDALTVILGDVTYGACCIDDYTALALGCDMLVHYGHSCLVPVDQTSIKTLYIFVEIAIDSSHLSQTIRLNFPDDKETFAQQFQESEREYASSSAGEIIYQTKHLRIEDGSSTPIEGPTNTEDPDNTIVERAKTPTRLALVSTIQFAAALQRLRDDLSEDLSPSLSTLQAGSSSSYNLWTGKYDTIVPRSRPLSPGEILGCTAPKLDGDVDALLYLGDGRFHLESIMIANPHLPAYRYDPYSKKLTRERYGHKEMMTMREDAVRTARKSLLGTSLTIEAKANSSEDVQNESPLWGVILGTLGRQGSFRQLQAITHQLECCSSSNVPPSASDGDNINLTVSRHYSAPTKPIPYIPILLSELSPSKLSLFPVEDISTFIQTSCPRLSIDWGYAFDRPLLSPYEAAVAVGNLAPWSVQYLEDRNSNKDDPGASDGGYRMDFYEAGTPWAVARVKGVY